MAYMPRLLNVVSHLTVEMALDGWSQIAEKRLSRALGLSQQSFEVCQVATSQSIPPTLGLTPQVGQFISEVLPVVVCGWFWC